MKITIFMFLGIMLGMIAFKFILNVITKKINYEYDKRNQLIAYILGVVVSLMFWYKYIENQINEPFFIIMLIVNIISIILIEISFIDFKYKEIPETYNISLALLSIISVLIYEYRLSTLINVSSPSLYIISMGVVMFIIYLLINILTRNLGMGDVKMSFGLGIALSLISIMGKDIGSFISVFKIALMSIMYHAYYSFALGAFVSVILIVSKKKDLKSKIAFGPYLSLGFLLFIFFSDFSIF